MYPFLIHGKLSKKSQQTYRVRNGRQQCYILNHSTPNSAKQLSNQALFGKISAIINRIRKDPKQIAHWQSIAEQSNIPNHTWRKAAYAHYKAKIIAQQQASATHISKTIKQKDAQYPNHTQINHLNTFLKLFTLTNNISTYKLTSTHPIHITNST